jgi:Protein of unknown function (DUF3606)
VNLKPIPQDEQRVNIFDEAEAKYWAKRFGCTRPARSNRHESWSDDQERGKGNEGGNRIRFSLDYSTLPPFFTLPPFVARLFLVKST